MKIKYSKDYSWIQMMYDSDMRMRRRGEEVTFLSEYSGNWKEEDVTLEQLQEYADAGYAIKINF